MASCETCGAPALVTVMETSGGFRHYCEIHSPHYRTPEQRAEDDRRSAQLEREEQLVEQAYADYMVVLREHQKRSGTCGPHCDMLMLHSPRWLNLVGALVEDEGGECRLFVLPIVEALWYREANTTSQVSLAQMVTSPCVIPLTQPALTALLSKAKLMLSDLSVGIPRRVNVGSVALNIERGTALSAMSDGSKAILHRLSSEQDGPPPSAAGLKKPGASFVVHANSPAPIVVVASLGTSWSLTTYQGGETETRLLPDSSLVAPLTEFKWKWPSASWSVLTAIRSELTSERWQQENERLEHGVCPYCDKYADDLQAARQRMNIAFSDEEPTPGQRPCPATLLRPYEQISRWPGNRPEGYSF